MQKSTSTFFDVIDRIREAGDLPTLPVIATTVMALASKPDTTLPEIAEVIETDQALAGRVLKVINSPAYGMRSEVGSVSKAILMLGFSEIRNITVGLSVVQMFSAQSGPAQFDREAFWNHSLSTGQLARAMADKLGCRFDGEEYTAGLLHDVGKIMLEQYCNEPFVDALDTSHSRSQPLHEAEVEWIGASHQQVGAWLVKRWRLPAAIHDAIAFHHDPASAKQERVLTAIVFLANIVANAEQLGFSGNRYRVPQPGNAGWQIIQQELPLYSVTPFDHFLGEMAGDIEAIRESGSIF